MILDFSQNGINISFEVSEKGILTLREFELAPYRSNIKKDPDRFPAADIHICGDSSSGHHGSKHVGTSGGRSLKYQSHIQTENEYGNKLEINLADKRMNVTLHYQFYRGISAVRAWVTVTNIGEGKLGLEYVSSFSYTGLESSDPVLYIPHNSWCEEVNWKKYTYGELGLGAANAHSVKRINIANTGSWSTKEYLPMGAIEDTHGTLMWQIENNGSWQWEISNVRPYIIYLKLAGPTEQENGWYKELAQGESFESVKVCLALGNGFDGALEQMTLYRRKIFENNPENETLPIIFNDFMHCMRCDPTTEKLLPVIDKASELGVEYFCTDAGWYADGSWWSTVGEWKPCEWRFPGGIKEVFDRIKQKGMVPGIWLEIEVMSTLCPTMGELDDDCFFVRHGKKVNHRGRYQLDFRKEKTRRYVDKVVDRVVREYGVGYIKFDYNIEIGVGTEIDADSFGDGLLENGRAYLKWIDEIKARYPHLVLENCSSGGMRMDYAMLAKHHVQSTSDQEDYRHTAIIAANAPTAVLPEQAAIWACSLESCDDEALNFIMANAMLSRIHLGGEIDKLSSEKFSLVKEAIKKYKDYRQIISEAIPFYPIGLNSYGGEWACVGYKTSSESYICVWRLCASGEKLVLPLNATQIETVFPQNVGGSLNLCEEGIEVTLEKNYTAVIFKIKA